ncbi:hypothetical protein [Azospirillum halopraeferens]|uniref:hypothetical protein n=1 Tax=Azospirillum halopraeferens TaxID=34010 RepID=UPI000423A3AA|nr:hypothetical protein [Azospirillum halopraeferens]
MQPYARPALLFLARHLAAGLLAGLSFCTGMLWFDVAGLGTLLLESEHMAVGLYLFFGSVCGTFGGVAMAVGVMNLGDHADRPDRKH